MLQRWRHTSHQLLRLTRFTRNCDSSPLYICIRIVLHPIEQCSTSWMLNSLLTSSQPGKKRAGASFWWLLIKPLYVPAYHFVWTRVLNSLKKYVEDGLTRLLLSMFSFTEAAEFYFKKSVSFCIFTSNQEYAPNSSLPSLGYYDQIF